MDNPNKKITTSAVTLMTLLLITVSVSVSKADHLSREQCYSYFDCVLGQESALNNCYDNKYLKKESLTRVMCMRMAQHNCKVKTGIQGTGRKLTITRPLDYFQRPTIIDWEEGQEMGQAQDIRIYNYAGWNHCPAQYQGLQDFWCDPHQTRYPPRPWCDVLPVYNVDIQNISGIPSIVKEQLLKESKTE